MKLIKLKSDNYNQIVTEAAYKEIRLQMSTGDFHTHKATVIKKPGPIQKKKALTLDALLFEERMKTLAKACELTFDGGNERMFYDQENIHVYASIMDKDDYERMENEIRKAEIKGKGYVVYAWNDESGYNYWNKDDESNYIQISVVVNVKDPSKLDPAQIKKDAGRLFGRLCGWHNVDAYYAWKNNALGA